MNVWPWESAIKTILLERGAGVLRDSDNIVFRFMYALGLALLAES